MISYQINAALDGEMEAVVSCYRAIRPVSMLYQTKRTLWGKVLCLQLDHWAWQLRESSISWPTCTAISSSDAVNLLWSVEMNCSVKTCSHYHSHLQHLLFQFTRTERIEAEILQTMWNCFLEMYLSRKSSWHLLHSFIQWLWRTTGKAVIRGICFVLLQTWVELQVNLSTSLLPTPLPTEFRQNMMEPKTGNCSS